MSLETNIAELRPLLIAELRRLQGQIGDEYRASEEDTEPSMQVTLGINDDASKYGLQTGDNSFTGAAYGFPHWGVSALYRDSDPEEVAKELLNQCEELAPAADEIPESPIIVGPGAYDEARRRALLRQKQDSSRQTDTPEE